jgi:hypothetical protein
MAVPLEIISNVLGAMSNALGSINTVQGVTKIAQGVLLQSQYISQVAFWTPIIATEFKGIVETITGAGQMFVGSIKFLPKFGMSFADGVFTFFTFSMTWMMCLFKNISNMQTCIFYYLLEAVGQILYLPFRLFLWVAYAIKIDLYPFEKQIWDFVETIDKIILKIAGFHISHYPKNIREKCYNCKRLKISTLVQRSMPLVNDVTVLLPKALMPGLNNIFKGARSIMNPFKSSKNKKTKGIKIGKKKGKKKK